MTIISTASPSPMKSRYARRLSAKFSWAQLDVTRRSIEETAAAILKLFTDRQRQRLPE